jgi:hypothetical protein
MVMSLPKAMVVVMSLPKVMVVAVKAKRACEK